MEITKCKICNTDTKQKFTAKILRKYDVQYYECPNCGFVQTEKPYWLEEAYQNPINVSDTGIVLRNQRLTRIVTSLIILLFDRKEKFLDYAGGFGLFTRMMRDTGFDFYWTDPYTKNELARGFEMKLGRKYAVVTSFEAFEHFENPTDELKKILEISDNIIISTELIPSPIPKVTDWWYYGTEHGQHIALYTKKSFVAMCKPLGLHYYSIDNIQILTKNPITFFSAQFLRIPYIKYLLYLMSFFFAPFLKPKTFDDMNYYKKSTD